VARTKAKKVRLGSQVVGLYYPGTKQFIKTVQRSRHFFWKLRSWGMERPILEALVDAGCKEIQIRDTEGRECFKVTPQAWLEDGAEHEFSAGRQFFLSRIHFLVQDF